MGLFSAPKQVVDPALPLFAGAYPFKGEIIDSKIIEASKSGSKIWELNNKLAEFAKENGFDAVHNIQYIHTQVASIAYGDAIKLKK